jgi:putative transposase
VRSVPQRQLHLDDVRPDRRQTDGSVARCLCQGEIFDVLVQAKRHTAAARKLMRKRLRKHGIAPTEWFMDKYVIYGSALRELGTRQQSHVTGRRFSNRAESSHVPARRRKRKMQRFKAPSSAQRFLSMHATTYNTFTIPRHLTTARMRRLLRAEAFAVWREAAGRAA